MHYVLLAYPKLSKADYDWIQQIRKVHDRQFTIVEPHFTIVFPTAKLSEKEFVENIDNQHNNVKSFDFSLTKAVVEENHYPKYFQVHLVGNEKIEEIVALHDLYYVDALTTELRQDIPFTPHITVASNEDETVMQRLANEINAKHINVRGKIDAVVVGAFDGKKVSNIKEVKLVSNK
jgi:2'-5' RNA ligase